MKISRLKMSACRLGKKEVLLNTLEWCRGNYILVNLPEYKREIVRIKRKLNLK